MTKYATSAQVAELAMAGQRVFGENHVQDAIAKIAVLADTSSEGQLEWHMVGHLQSNKVSQALDAFDIIQSVDSLKLARAISDRGATAGRRHRVLLEVNVAADPAKFGFESEAIRALYADMVAMPGLSVEGLMTIGPPTDSPEAARPVFAKLRQLREELDAQAVALPMPHLSMGMSADFEVAIEEGATIVRVGTALVGSHHGGAAG